MIDFATIHYLKNGNPKQKRAYDVLKKYNIFEILDPYSPLLAGTIPIEIDTESSDLDIICNVDPASKDVFLNDLIAAQVIPPGTEITVEEVEVRGERCIVLNFTLEEFPVEIFGQNKPSAEQNAYRHMVAEYSILLEKGEKFKQKIIDLKRQGMKTEPAFGLLMNLENPYEDLLK
ncbi:DUF4269 domain-containing protein [Chryseobacterium pennipullorum]|uniref:DUF4269 domain-containing protein n=1 Tax=Chryseobacterium pennipullorum TaxID=2258963 RepID=A0A3D9B0X3_9FLAO|nr:DUF4269 domain-containing protein [Chryseobacterium pennipullorum]REC47290.1 DUF4269 domain-containing protein [Chryseobacterium pennipullorum]